MKWNQWVLRMAFVGAVLPLGLGSFADSASAALIYGTPADLTGSRSESGGGLVTGGNWNTDAIDQTIQWSIVANVDGTWTYTYTFTGFLSPEMSHWILDLSDDAVLPGKPEDPDVVTEVNLEVPLVFDTYDGSQSSNPGLPGTIIGVKFDELEDPGSPFSITFTSNRAPVWGDHYAKGGSNSFAYNPGVADHSIEDSNAFIARPDGAVPEPGTLALAGIGLGAAALVSARRRIGRKST